ncbi:MAG TPA: DUF3306 domain-containing protein [Rhizobiales bacterium]|nr:DUF3306 domain-containing protein [Hyphomicrobiales bacterium]
MSGDEKGFAARWSERKIAAREDSVTNEILPDQDLSLPEEHAIEDVPDADGSELLTEEDFDDVDFEALDKSSDYTRFAKSNVPAAIQQKALRKLWESDSVFEVLDGMNDYDEDFTGNGLAGKVLKTAYKAGRGFLTEEIDQKPSENSSRADLDTAPLIDDSQPLDTDGQNHAEKDALPTDKGTA